MIGRRDNHHHLLYMVREIKVNFIHLYLVLYMDNLLACMPLHHMEIRRGCQIIWKWSGSGW